MSVENLYERYLEMQSYIGWTDADAELARACGPVLEKHLYDLVDDFYEEIERHPQVSQILEGSEARIERLKEALRNWLRELLAVSITEEYVQARWRVGLKHVEIGLDQVFVNAALARLRRGMLEHLASDWPGNPVEAFAAARSLCMLLDLDLALIEDAYQAEYLARQQRNERLATVGHMAGGIAHELRSPLNVIRTSAYYLLNAEAPSPEKVREHLERIEQHVLAADEVMNALSRFAQMIPPDVQRFDLTELILEIIEGSPLPVNILPELENPTAQQAQVLADREQIRIVLENLVRNACEAMPEGGRLTVRVRVEDDTAKIEVVDTGIGIEAERLEKILEPLHTTKPHGLGLGLSLSKALTDRNRGRLQVQSEPGQGSTFAVVLPLASSE